MRTFLSILSIVLLIVFGLAAYAQIPGEPTETDGIRHSVPLEDIIFDDFDNRFNRALPFTRASEDDIVRLRDRIRPLCHGDLAACLPIAYEPAAAGDQWLSDDHFVLGYVDADGVAYAYPFGILNFHEIVNDTLADVPVLISYCPLCNSAVVYSRVVDGDTLLFGNTSALYQSDMVMYDTDTDSYWFQAGGEAVVGPRTGQRLTPLPAVVSHWEDWHATHPDTLVLARPAPVDYARNPFDGYEARVNKGQFAFPVDGDLIDDDRLLPGDNVLVLNDSLAFPLSLLGDAATTTTIDGDEVVVLSLADGPAGAAYRTALPNGGAVALVYEDGAWVDSVTGSVFGLDGVAMSGQLAGTPLEAVPSRYLFWFSALVAHPQIAVF